jgi:hypothetical protein
VREWIGQRLTVFFFLACEKGMPGAKKKAQTLWNEMNKDDIKHLERKLRDIQSDPQKVFAAMQDQTTSCR